MHRSPHAERSSPHAIRAMEAFRRIVRALRLSGRAAESASGLSSAQLLVLRTLAASPGCSLAELAEATLTDPSSVSVVVRRLAERRLVARRAAADDGRRAELSLTPRGLALTRRAPPPAQERLFEALRGLGAPRLEALARGLASVERAMGASLERPALFFEDERPRPRPRARRRS